MDEMDEDQVDSDAPQVATALVQSAPGVGVGVDEKWMGTMIESLVSSFTQTAITSCTDNKVPIAVKMSHPAALTEKSAAEAAAPKPEQGEAPKTAESPKHQQPAQMMPAQNVALISSMLQHLARAVPQEFYRMQSQQALDVRPHTDLKRQQVAETMA